jgi:uncharacterized membrane protein YciS (DUF1049 family)
VKILLIFTLSFVLGWVVIVGLACLIASRKVIKLQREQRKYEKMKKALEKEIIRDEKVHINNN